MIAPGARRIGAAAGAVALTAVLAGCAAGGHPAASATAPATRPTAAVAALIREARPIGRGARFHPPARGPLPGRCRATLGPRTGVHLELFAADRVVLVAAGIGTRGPVRRVEGRIAAARCFGDLVTLEPTGVVLVAAGTTAHLRDVFRAWGQPLGPGRLAGFSAGRGGRVAVFVDGRRWRGAPGGVPLRRHAEIVLEVGPHVPPHRGYTFPPGA